MKQISTWIISMLLIIFGIPAVLILGGGFYSPELLENVQRSGGVQPKDQNQEIIQILASIIPYTQELETIKAHAVMVRSYIARREGNDVAGELPQFTYQEMKQIFGEDFDEIYSRYQQAVEETEGEIIIYENEVIEPLYHKESAGYTRDGKNLYDIDIPYLKSVKSEEPGESEQKVILKQEFIKILEQNYPEIVIDVENIEYQIQVIQKDNIGYIDSLQIGNIVIEGEVFKELIGLNSTCFTLHGIGDVLLFEVKGIGHGIGLSQHGANLMAEEGCNYIEILTHYYQNVEIK